MALTRKLREQVAQLRAKGWNLGVGAIPRDAAWFDGGAGGGAGEEEEEEDV